MWSQRRIPTSPAIPHPLMRPLLAEPWYTSIYSYSPRFRPSPTLSLPRVWSFLVCIVWWTVGLWKEWSAHQLIEILQGLLLLWMSLEVHLAIVLFWRNSLSMFAGWQVKLSRKCRYLRICSYLFYRHSIWNDSKMKVILTRPVHSCPRIDWLIELLIDWLIDWLIQL